MSRNALRFARIEDMPQSMREMAARQLTPTPQLASPKEGKPRSGKFNASPTHVNGIRFDSKKEARYFERLTREQQAGLVRHFHRQVIFDLEGGVIYKCDFLVFYADDTHAYIDVKGLETKEFKMKMRMVRARYGIEVETV